MLWGRDKVPDVELKWNSIHTNGHDGDKQTTEEEHTHMFCNTPDRFVGGIVNDKVMETDVINTEQTKHKQISLKKNINI